MEISLDEFGNVFETPVKQYSGRNRDLTVLSDTCPSGFTRAVVLLSSAAENKVTEEK